MKITDYTECENCGEFILTDDSNQCVECCNDLCDECFDENNGLCEDCI